jgi:hypothetical protein
MVVSSDSFLGQPIVANQLDALQDVCRLYVMLNISDLHKFY